MPGAAAETRLTKGSTYRIFFHYRNGIGSEAPLVLSFTSANGKAFDLEMRAGVGEPGRDPTLVGRQAMARYLTAPRKRLVSEHGTVNIPLTLRPRDIASGVMSVVADRDVRLHIYLRHDRWTIPGAKVVAFNAPAHEMSVALTKAVRNQYRRIGLPEPGAQTIYGLVYAIRIDAPRGSHVRIAFSPRGGNAGLVGLLDGTLRQSAIVRNGWTVFADAIVGKNGLLELTTAPFGGVFYPVEVAFRLL